MSYHRKNAYAELGADPPQLTATPVTRNTTGIPDGTMFSVHMPAFEINKAASYQGGGAAALTSSPIKTVAIVGAVAGGAYLLYRHFRKKGSP